MQLLKVFTFFVVLIQNVIAITSNKSSVHYELKSVNQKWVLLGENYNVSQCCGGLESPCRYPEQGPGDGVSLHFIPKSAVNNKDGLIDFAKVRTFHIFLSTLDKEKCSTIAESEKNRKLAKIFAQKVGLKLVDKGKRTLKTPFKAGGKYKCKTKKAMNQCSYRSFKDEWKINIKNGWKHDCADLGCDRYLYVDGEFRKKKFIFSEVYKGNGWQGVNGAETLERVLLIRPFTAFMELKIESPRLFFF